MLLKRLRTQKNSSSSSRLLFAVGGTGGHLFPAQAVAKELKENEGISQILFAGKNLGKNPFFDQSAFTYKEVSSATPYSRRQCIKAPFSLIKGVWQACQLLYKSSPTLVVGFGSFYSFPLLLAAWLLKIPYILVETNVIPGRVNRLFASRALFSALQFQETAAKIKGKVYHTTIPVKGCQKTEKIITPEEAKLYYGLDPETATLLVFGGSQGAQAINTILPTLKLSFPWQVIHFCGAKASVEELKEAYNLNGISSHVKHFESEMQWAWSAADLAICRAGAGTLMEIIHFGVPAILIPWGGAAENHQMANGKLMEKKGGAVVVSSEKLEQLEEKVSIAYSSRAEMKQALAIFAQDQQAPQLRELISKTLKELDRELC